MGYRIYKMNSWDCFDTLVARRFHHPHSIFDEVSKILNIPNFKELRILAEENSDGTIEGIYKNLPGVSPDIEISVDISHCYPIVSNIKKVKDGDYIISDIFYNEKTVRKILLNCGLDKSVKYYVSPNGKKSGSVWKHMPTINLHTGDNYKTDIKSPTKFGIKSEHYTGSNFNEIENEISKNNNQLACWMKYVRLSCPFINENQIKLWEDQSNFNLPILALASLELPSENIAFTSRDCLYWKLIYESLTGRKSIKLDASRKCYYHPSNEYVEYATNQTKNCVIADLQGSGKSFYHFFKNTRKIYYVGGPIINQPNIFSISNMQANALEKHNCSPEGTLIDWGDGPIRTKTEHSAEIIEVQQTAVEIGLRSLKFYKIDKNLINLKFLLEKMNKNYTHRTIPWIENH